AAAEMTLRPAPLLITCALTNMIGTDGSAHLPSTSRQRRILRPRTDRPDKADAALPQAAMGLKSG
ncbi:hypothetical protein, partial [Rhizobium lentis]|uniref:hypothetical protein n=1 Tax=Rhizobium lentis TaxID=1138194 RepID=UPI001C8387D7